VSWDWASAYYLAKFNVPSFRKIQVLHYEPLEEYLKDYMPADLIPKFIEAYYSDMTKVAISKVQMGDFNGRKVYHWLQGINLDIFFRQKTAIGDPPRILIPLRKPKEKGAFYALQAAEIIFRHNRDVAISSFGDYKGNVPGFINHHGRVNFFTLLELYRESDIFVLPSIAEGFSYPGLEAMASGCALVSTRNGGSDQYITDRHDGILVEPGDGSALAKAVIELIENRRLLKKIIFNGQETVLGYSYQKASERFIEILREIEAGP
jgi:glycosyltransferase involved in cell wall biosynthesis